MILCTLLMTCLLLMVGGLSVAQDSMRWGLPDGAKARIGKGKITGKIAYSSDGTRLAVVSSIGIWLYDTQTHQAVALFAKHMGGFGSFAFSPEGRTLTSVGRGEIRVWDVITGAHRSTLIGHTDTIYGVAFSPDGNTLAIGDGGEIRLWDVITGAHKSTLTGHTGGIEYIAFSPDGRTLASASRDTTVRLWDAVTGAHTRTLKGHTDQVRDIRFSPDGRTLASRSSDGTALLWALTTAPMDPLLFGDVNRDGVVNALDLAFIGFRFGQPGHNDTDVNGDGVVDILDLVMVAAALGDAAASASPQGLARLTAAEVEGWLTQTQGLDPTDATLQRGRLFLERLLTALAPKENALLPNYPNPFNPETWIPYHLAYAADVQVTIYDIKGVMVRRLTLGHRPAGYYTDRSKAAYWDGRNHLGKPVGSGIYFYHLHAGGYSATRKMVMRK